MLLVLTDGEELTGRCSILTAAFFTVCVAAFAPAIACCHLQSTDNQKLFAVAAATARRFRRFPAAALGSVASRVRAVKGTAPPKFPLGFAPREFSPGWQRIRILRLRIYRQMRPPVIARPTAGCRFVASGRRKITAIAVPQPPAAARLWPSSSSRFSSGLRYRTLTQQRFILPGAFDIRLTTITIISGSCASAHNYLILHWIIVRKTLKTHNIKQLPSIIVRVRAFSFLL